MLPAFTILATLKPQSTVYSLLLDFRVIYYVTEIDRRSPDTDGKTKDLLAPPEMLAPLQMWALLEIRRERADIYGALHDL